MSIHRRKHKIRTEHPEWWKRYFWSRDEYWAKYAAYIADARARRQGRRQGRGRVFWSQVAQRARAHCEQHYGPVPGPLHVWSKELRLWIAGPRVMEWLRVQSPLLRRRRGRRSEP